MTLLRFELTAEQKQAVMLQINERLYEKGEISTLLYEAAKTEIISKNRNLL